MSVPEATVYEQGRAIARKRRVWLSGYIARMKSVAKPLSVKRLADFDFWPGIFATDSRHHPAARRLVNDVTHASFVAFSA